MRKAFLASALALGLVGCAATSSPPEIRDLSVSRDRQGGESVTVESGDTLYGIAWRQGMDFRELARLNGISPPYRLQPGQTLRLTPGTTPPPGGSGPERGAEATGTAGGGTNVAEASDAQNPEWLTPDTQAIERNRRLTSRPLDAAQPSDEAPTTAGQADGAQTPGPLYDYDSPGADGKVSARDQAEREALASQRAAAQSTAGNEAADPRQRAPADGQEERSTAADTPGTSTADNPDGQADAGTAVAGGTNAPEPQQRTYKPVADIPWQWPSEGQLIAGFGDNSDITSGIDIAGQKGQPVKAAGPGIVVYAGDGVRGYGNLILLKHNDQFLSAYAHNDSLRVEENDVVEAGEVIATMGNTDADRVKLHFEVRQDGQPQDPLQFLPQR